MILTSLGKRIIGIIVVAGVILDPVLPAQSKESYKDVEVSLGGARLKDRFMLVLLGRLPRGGRQNTQLGIRNTGVKSITLDAVGISAMMTAVWAQPSGELANRATIVPGASALLNVQLNYEAPVIKGRPPIITLFRDTIPVTTIVFEYTIHPAEVTLEWRTIELPSGLGKDFSGTYTMVSGPAPYGYTLYSHTFEAYGSQRACGTYIICGNRQADDDNVKYEFEIQGFERNNQQLANQIAHAVGHLTVVYRLKPSQAAELVTEGEFKSRMSQ